MSEQAGCSFRNGCGADFIKAGGFGHCHVEQSDVVCVDLEELEYPIPSS